MKYKIVTFGSIKAVDVTKGKETVARFYGKTQKSSINRAINYVERLNNEENADNV